MLYPSSDDDDYYYDDEYDNDNDDDNNSGNGLMDWWYLPRHFLNAIDTVGNKRLHDLLIINSNLNTSSTIVIINGNVYCISFGIIDDAAIKHPRENNNNIDQ